MVQKRNLDEVSFIRPILIILVVLYHSMCIHTGNWDLPEGCTVIPAYKFIGKLAYSFMLESFVFVSGYTWAYLNIELKRKDSFWSLCKKKLLRLMLPTIIWGTLYCIIIEGGVTSFIYVLEGPGHLWFLPMLFECFILGWFILHMKISPCYVLPVLFLIALFRQSGLPFQLYYTSYYLFFFLLGYYGFIFVSENKQSKLIKFKYIIISWLFFFFAFFSLVAVRAWIISNVHLPLLLGGGKNLCMIIYSTLGTVSLVATSIYITNSIELKIWYIKMGNLCMGVYIFQQFILKLIYYTSPLISFSPNWAVALEGFLLTLTISIILSYLLKGLGIFKYLL